MKTKQLLLPGVFIVLSVCCFLYIYIEEIYELGDVSHLAVVSLDDGESSLDSSLQFDSNINDIDDNWIYDDKSGGLFIKEGVIPFLPDTLNTSPWSPFHLNIPSLLQTLHDNGISTVESLDFKTLSPREAGLQNVMWDDEVPLHYMTCSNLSTAWHYPIGAPSLPMNSSVYFNEFPHSDLPSIEFSQMIDFDALCIVHTPGFFADNTIFNRHQFYAFTYQWMGTYRCWDNKTMDFLCNTSLSSCSEEGDVEEITIEALPLSKIKVLNIAFRITGWGATAFSHFHIFAVPQFAMIYGLLVEWKQHTISMLHTEDGEDTVDGGDGVKWFYNITIVTHTNGKRGDIIPWFWSQFGLKARATTMVTTLMNITVTPSKSWCRSPFSNIHYSPMVMSPYFLRYKSKYSGQIRMNWKMLARDSMLNIKPFISNLSAPRDLVLYMSRGTSNKRGVSNNGEVMQILKQFINDNQHRLPSGLEMKFEEFGTKHTRLSRDDQKQLFSRVAVMIGPHGGAFANENLMQPGSFVVEFIDWWADYGAANVNKKRKFRPCYYALAQAGGMHYYMVKPDNFNFDHGKMSINIEYLLTVMNAVYDRIARDGFK